MNVFNLKSCKECHKDKEINKVVPELVSVPVTF